MSRFAEVVQRFALEVAVRSPHSSVTYGQLDAWTNQIAQELRALGAESGKYVAIVCAPSIEGIAAIIGVLKSGAAFVPIDPAWPEARKSQVVRSILPVATILAAENSSEEVAGPTIRLSERNDAPRSTDFSGPSTDVSGLGHAVAYAIFTSGSTGVPRGVSVGRDSIWHYAQWASQAYSGARRSTLLFSSLSFDLSLTAVFVPLLNGGTIFTSGLELGELQKVVGEHQIEFLKVTPSHLELLEFFPSGALPSSHLVVGGEQLFGDSIPRRLRSISIVNEYGPTETTVGCTYYTLADADFGPGAVPIGRPAQGVSAYVLDGNLKAVGDGERGELYISGPGVARGYVNDPFSTASKFVANPYGPPGSRMYRTGDVVSIDNGCLTFVDRIDNQVKVAGHRIEPAEVEAALRRVPGVSEAHVKAWGMGAASKLIAYYRQSGEVGPSPTPDTLRKSLAACLPGYMVPAAFVRLDQFPLTVNGKVDSRSLPEPDFVQSPSITGLPE